MSEQTPEVLVSTSPNKRRRWMLAILIVLMACGGAYWWQSRLTAEERFLVGRWAQFEPAISMQVPQKTWVINPDRLMHTVVPDNTGSLAPNGQFIPAPIPAPTLLHWTCRSGEFRVTQQKPLARTIHDWINSGFKTWGSELVRLRLKIVDHDTVEIRELDQPAGKNTNSAIWKRLPAK